MVWTSYSQKASEALRKPLRRCDPVVERVMNRAAARSERLKIDFCGLWGSVEVTFVLTGKNG